MALMGCRATLLLLVRLLILCYTLLRGVLACRLWLFEQGEPNHMTHNQVKEIIYSLQRDYPRAYEQVLREVESGEVGRAKQLLHGMSGLVGEGYVDLVLEQLTAQVTESHISWWETLQENPDALRILIRSGNRSEAIELYHERTGEAWQASLDFIKSLEQKLEAEAVIAASALQGGADLAVLFFLLKAGHLDDAVRYYGERTGSPAESARAMIIQMQQDIVSGHQTLPELGKRAPDPNTIRFLLQAGHETIAIRYYRDCTEVSMLEARQAIAQMRNREV
jgi:hypothetical protein